VAVLVDHGVRWEGKGASARRVLEPPSPERLKVVKDVVAGVIGFQQDRGDQVLVETLPFEATLLAAPAEPEPPASAAPGGFVLPKWLEPLMKTAPMPVWLGAAAALLVVFAVIAFLLFRKLFRRRGKTAAVQVQHALPEKQGHEQLSPAEAQQQFEEKTHALLAANEATRERAEEEALAALRLPPNTKKSEVLKKVIAEDTKKDPARMAQLVRTWLNEKSR
jgi:flagellar M-ring protein FliF